MCAFIYSTNTYWVPTITNIEDTEANKIEKALALFLMRKRETKQIHRVRKETTYKVISYSRTCFPSLLGGAIFLLQMED